MSRAGTEAERCTIGASRLRPLAAVSLVAAVLVLLPLVFGLLAPPAALADGPTMSAATRDISVAALGQLERWLHGDLDAPLLETRGMLCASWALPYGRLMSRRAGRADAPASVACESARRL